MGEKYRFMFNTSGLTRDTKIGQHIYTFEPEKSRKMYVTYSIPKVEEPTLIKDCLVLVIGYQMKIKLQL